MEMEEVREDFAEMGDAKRARLDTEDAGIVVCIYDLEFQAIYDS